MESVFSWKRVTVLAVILVGALLLAVPAFAGYSTIYGSDSFSVDGNTRVRVCDGFANFRNANATYTRNNGNTGIVYDDNGANSGCGTSFGGDSGIRLHTTHEGSADGNTSRH